MHKENQQKSYLHLFWKKEANSCKHIKSIDAVYSIYSDFIKQYNSPPINKYIFRTYIRKHGYSNS